MELIGESRREVAVDVCGATESGKEHQRRAATPEIQVMQMDVVVYRNQFALRSSTAIGEAQRLQCKHNKGTTQQLGGTKPEIHI